MKIHVKSQIYKVAVGKVWSIKDVYYLVIISLSMIRTDSFDIMMATLKFNDRINEQDLEDLAELMTENHTFIDSYGETIKGKDVMKESGKTSLGSIQITETYSPL